MTSDQARLTVGDYVTLVRGTTYQGALVGEPGPALLGLGSIEPGGGFRIGKYSTYGGDCPADLMLFPGDIYASLKGATKDGKMIGSVARVPCSVPSGRLTQDTVKLVFRRPSQDDSVYLYWVLRTPQYRDYCAGHAMGSAVVALSRRDFLSYPVPQPTVPRRALVALLDALDERIEINRRMSEILEAVARALFKSWFVDFDPVRAKAQGRDSELPKHLADLFPASFEDSVLGPLPSGWGTRPLGDLFTLDKGLSYKGLFLTDHGLPMINLGCFLGQGRFSAGAIKKYSGEFKPRHVVRSLDLLLANTDITQQRRVIGSPALVPPQGGRTDFLFSHHVFAARFPEDAEPWRLFVYFMLLQEGFRARASGFATGTTVLSLPRDAVLNLRCPNAPRTLVDAFTAIALSLLGRTWKIAQESGTLAAIRDALLPKLISGELRLVDPQAFPSKVSS